MSAPNETIPRSRETAHHAGWTGFLHLLVVYLVWGSTYLAIRVAVREGSGFPPFSVGASRAILGGLVLLLWAAASRDRLKLTRREALILATSGLLLWTGGNGLVVWAEQRIHSAYAALLVSTTPIWAALVESIIDRRVPSLLLIVALLLGFCGAGLLAAPIMLEGVAADNWAVIGLVFASLSWACGSIFQNRHPVKLGARTSAAYQQLFGSIGFVALALAAQEPWPHPRADAWWAWGYLVVFGSILAFTSFVQALRLLPTGIVFTYAYVNPLIAVILGWLVLKEPITWWTLAGAGFILAGVAGVFRDRVGRGRKTAKSV